MADFTLDSIFHWEKNKRLLVFADRASSSAVEPTAAKPYQPNYILTDKTRQSTLIASMGGAPTIANLADYGGDDGVMAAIRKQVSEHGTQKELVIDYVRYQRGFFKDIIRLQQETGIKVADRIVLDGGGRFGNLNEGDVAFYKSMAFTLNAEVVGATSDIYAGAQGPMHGHFVKFTPTGGVERDRLYDNGLAKIEEQYYAGNPSMRPKSPEPSQGGVPASEAWVANELTPENRKKFLFMLTDRTDLLQTNDKGINTSGDYSPSFEVGSSRSMGGHPTKYYLNSASEGIYDPGVVIRTLREQVKKYGTQDEVWIEGHSSTNHSGITADLDTEQFLRDVKGLEKELGVKVANRFVFGGCRVFANLSPQDQSFYQYMAHDLNAEIAASMTLSAAKDSFDDLKSKDASQVSGHFVEFTPDGKVTKDRLYDPQWKEDAYYKADGKNPPRYNVAADENWFNKLKPDPTPNAPKQGQKHSGPEN